MIMIMIDFDDDYDGLSQPACDDDNEKQTKDDLLMMLRMMQYRSEHGPVQQNNATSHH